MFFNNLYNSFVTKFKFLKLKPRVNELTKLYEKGTEKLYKHFDIIKLLKDVKFTKLLAKFMLKPPYETKF